MNRRRRTAASRGFTLIELLLVVAIIGVIMGIVVIAVNPSRQFAQVRNTQRWSEVNAIASAISQHALESGGSHASGIDGMIRMLGTAADNCDIECGGVQGAASEFIDDTKEEFDFGSYAGTQWNGSDGVDISVDSPGTYTSSIKDGLDGNTEWNNFSWSPGMPYGKQLPDNGASESGYASGNANMNGISVLWHLDESSGQVMDSSGNGKNSSVVSGVTYNAPGKFGSAISLDGDDYIDFPVIFPGSPHASSLDEMTAGAWFKTSTPPVSAGTIVWVGKGGSFALQMNSDGDVSFWIKQTKNDGGNYNGNWVGINSADEIPSGYVDGNWHYITGRYHRLDNEIRLYVDGVMLDNTPDGPSGMDATEFLSYPTTNHPPVIGASTSISNPKRLNFFIGDIDEIAIYSRALSDQEILEHYRRGMLSLKFQVRSCDDEFCVGEDFVGSDNTTSTYYDDADSIFTTPPSHALSLLPANRYFQYQATFESDDAGDSPNLHSVTMVNSNMGGGNEVTPPACLDLFSDLIPTYLSVLPVDPRQGTEERTDYAVKLRANNRIEARACSAELNESIAVVE